MTSKDRVIILLFLAFTVDLIFTWFEFNDYERQLMHPFYEGHTYQNGNYWDGSVTTANFAHGFFRRLTTAIVFMCAVWAIQARMHVSLFWMCVCLELVDAFDYWLTRSDEWFTLPVFTLFGTTYYDYEIEFNHFRLIAVVVYFIVHKWKKL